MKLSELDSELLLRYLDGELAEEESRRATELLSSSSEARHFVQDVALQAVALVESDPSAAPVEPVRSVDNRRQAAMWGGGGLLMALSLSVVLLALITGGRDDLLTVVRVEGEARWIGDGGREVAVRPEAALSGGTLELLSGSSWVDLRFQDGTLVTLAGPSLLTISEERAKELYLRKGSLSAEVAPQPSNAPMLVRTPAAELEVLGTQFNLDVDSLETQLAVNEGLVRMRRVMDGEEVDVPRAHRAVASLDDSTSLTIRRRAESRTTWQPDLGSDVRYGKWVSTAGGQLKKDVAEGVLSAEEAAARYRELLSLNREAGSVWALPVPRGKLWQRGYRESLLWLSVPPSEVPVTLEEDAEFRIVGRLLRLDVRADVRVEFGVSTNYVGGGLAGKFASSHSAREFPAEMFSISLPVDEFFSTTGTAGSSPVGQELRDWWCLVEGQAKIAIADVKLVVAGTTE